MDSAGPRVSVGLCYRGFHTVVYIKPAGDEVSQILFILLGTLYINFISLKVYLRTVIFVLLYLIIVNNILVYINIITFIIYFSICYLLLLFDCILLHTYILAP